MGLCDFLFEANGGHSVAHIVLGAESVKSGERAVT